MPEPRGDDLELIAEFQAGSEAAARELFDKYCERLMRLASRRIGQRLTSRVDPEDVVQSVFRTFFTRARNDEFSFHEQDDLLKLLVRLTVNKVLRQVAHHRPAKRNSEALMSGGRTARPMRRHSSIIITTVSVLSMSHDSTAAMNSAG